MSELEQIVNKYFSEDGKATVFYNIEQEEFNKLIKNMGIFERPDILSVYDNKVIGIEHFEFDSYKRTRKGSDFQRKHAIIDSNMKKKIKDELQPKETIIIHNEIESTASLDNYYENFRKNFIEHYNKIDDYHQHILEEIDCTDKNIEFWKDKCLSVINLIKDKLFGRGKVRDRYRDVSIDLYSKGIISDETFEELKNTYVFSKEHDSKEKDDFDLEI